jgi:hypothetical protein
MSEVFITRKGGGGKTSAPELLITEVGGSWIEFEVTNTDQVQSAQIFLLANYDTNSTDDFDVLATQNGTVITVAAGATATEFITGLDNQVTHTISAQAAVIKKLLSSIVTTDPTNLLQTELPSPTLGTPIDPITDTSLQIPVTNNETKIPLVIKVAVTTSTATPSVYPFEITVQPNSTSNITITGLTVFTSYYYHAIAVDGDVESNNIFIGPFVKQEVPLYAFSSWIFTNSGVTGRNGPTIAQVRSAYSSQSWAQNNTYLSMTTQGVQTWTVPQSGTYQMTVAGAVGGGRSSTTAGRGGAGILRITANLTKGDSLNLVVGQQGTPGTSGHGGGAGGGSYVYSGAIGGNGLIVAAAGGAGADDSTNAQNARSDLNPTNNSSSVIANDGQGGFESATGGGGSAGWLSNGSGNAYAGTRWVGGAALYSGVGGFGGGGGDADDGAPAGGFSGGDGAYTPGAGGSYYAGLTVPGGYTSIWAPQTNYIGWQGNNTSAHGSINIIKL